MHPKVGLLTTSATVLVALIVNPAVAQDPPASATAACNDGTYSTSVSRQGACSGHGGVAEWFVPADATARCRDGTYSFSSVRQGTCSNHGGVAEWLEIASDSAYIRAMKTDLRNLVVAEEAFFADSVKYTTTIGNGGLDYLVTEGNTAPRILLTADGWRATKRGICFLSTAASLAWDAVDRQEPDSSGASHPRMTGLL